MKTLTLSWLATVVLTVAGMFWLPMDTVTFNGIALSSDVVGSNSPTDAV